MRRHLMAELLAKEDSSVNGEQAIVPTNQGTEIYLRLRSMTGSGVRLTPATGGQSRSGTLERVVVTGALFALGAPLQGLNVGSPIYLEVFSDQGLVLCTATIQAVDEANRIWVDLPAQLEVIQRRRHQRVDVQLEAGVQVDPEAEPVTVQVVNISVGGLAFVAETPYQPGQMVILHLRVQALGPAEIAARVVRSSGADQARWLIGVAFDPMNPAQVARIEQYVSSLLEG